MSKPRSSPSEIEDAFVVIWRGYEPHSSAQTLIRQYIQSLEEQLEAVRKGLEREANIADRYVTGPHGAIRSAWADMAGNLRQLAAYLGSNPATRPEA